MVNKFALLTGCLVGTLAINETFASKNIHPITMVHSENKHLCLKLLENKIEGSGNTCLFSWAVITAKKVWYNHNEDDENLSSKKLDTYIDTLNNGTNTIEHIVKNHITSEDTGSIISTIKVDGQEKTAISMPQLFKAMDVYANNTAKNNDRDVRLKGKFARSLARCYSKGEMADKELNIGYIIFDVMLSPLFCKKLWYEIKPAKNEAEMSSLEIYSDSSIGQNDLFFKIACHFKGDFKNTEKLIIKSVYPVKISRDQLAGKQNFENVSYKSITIKCSLFETLKILLQKLIYNKIRNTTTDLYDEDIFDCHDIAYFAESAFNEKEYEKFTFFINLCFIRYKQKYWENTFISPYKIFDVILSNPKYEFLTYGEKSFIKNFVYYHPALDILLFTSLFGNRIPLEATKGTVISLWRLIKAKGVDQRGEGIISGGRAFNQNELHQAIGEEFVASNYDISQLVEDIFKGEIFDENEPCRAIGEGLVTNNNEANLLVKAIYEVEVNKSEYKKGPQKNLENLISKIIIPRWERIQMEKCFSPSQQALTNQACFKVTENCYMGIDIINKILKLQMINEPIFKNALTFADDTNDNFYLTLAAANVHFLTWLSENTTHIRKAYLAKKIPEDQLGKSKSEKEIRANVLSMIEGKYYYKELFVFDENTANYFNKLYKDQEINFNIVIIGKALNAFNTFSYNFFCRFVRMWAARDYLKEKEKKNEKMRTEALGLLEKDIGENPIAEKLFYVMQAILEKTPEDVEKAVQNVKYLINEILLQPIIPFVKANEPKLPKFYYF